MEFIKKAWKPAADLFTTIGTFVIMGFGLTVGAIAALSFYGALGA